MPVEVFKVANRFIQRNITVVFASNVRYYINFKLSKLKWIVHIIINFKWTKWMRVSEQSILKVLANSHCLNALNIAEGVGVGGRGYSCLQSQ